MNSKAFAQTLFSNQAIIEHHKIPWLFGALLFVVSIFLTTIPFYVSSFQPTNYESYYPGITDALYSFMEEQSCVIQNAQLTCMPRAGEYRYADYQFVVYDHTSKANPDDLAKESALSSGSAIYFYQDALYFNDGNERVIEGTYVNLGEFAFQDVIRNNKLQGVSKTDLVNVFLKNIELSRVSLHMGTITMSLFLQYLMFTVLIAYLFRFAKGRSLEWNFTYGDSFRMIVLSMLSPALLCALLALFLSSVATLIFPFAYVVRVVFLYMRLSRYGVLAKQNGDLMY